MSLCMTRGAPWEPEEPGAGWVPCCIGSAAYGPQGCTCWEPAFDLEQTEPRTEVRDDARGRACHDCAYRPDSPERALDPDHLDDIITRGDIFWCHQGIRRVVEYRHPDGRVYPVPPLAAGVDGAYEPPIIDGRPYKADGTPADVCAGWWARFERRDEVRA